MLLSLIIVGSLSYELPRVPEPPSSRRSVLQTAVAAGSAALFGPAPSSARATLENYNPELAVTRPEAGQFYFPTLTPPFRNRATYRYELGRNAWALEQLLVFANVTATVRTVVVKMDDEDLVVFGPQWPTGEYCSLLEELGRRASLAMRLSIRYQRQHSSRSIPRRLSGSPQDSTDLSVAVVLISKAARWDIE